MKKIMIICALVALISGCASRKCYKNHPAKKSHQPDALLGNKENRFIKQFQEADSMFNQTYNRKGYGM